MPTLKQEFIYFNDPVGRTLPNAKLYAYAAGTTTPKNTYTDKSLTNANPHPVVADAAGRFPVIWLASGGYRIIVEDQNGVQIHDRDDISSADAELNATSSIYFKTLADLKLLIAQNGQTVNPQIGEALRTTGKTSTTDDLGAEWVVVAAGTGTADDDTYVNLDNGLQAERVFNQLYRKNNGSDIENKATFRTNIDVYDKASVYTQAAADAKFLATADLPTQLGVSTLIWNKTPTTTINMDTDIDGGNPGDGFYLVRLSGSNVKSTIYIESGSFTSYGSGYYPATAGDIVIEYAIKNTGNEIKWVERNYTAGTTTEQNISEIYKIG